MAQQNHHEHEPKLATADSVRRNIVRKSSLEYANANVYPNLTQESTLREDGNYSPTGKPYPFFVPSSLKSTLGSPTALAIGAFATTLTTLSLSLMEFRGVTTTNVYIGNFFFIAGTGMVVSAQWELVLGNSFGYTALSTFGFFYGGFGAILTPLFGVTASYSTDAAGQAEYNNALGFWVLMYAVFNLFFTIATLAINLVYFGIFFFVEIAFILIAASYFAAADGHTNLSTACAKTGGAFAFLSAMLGWYTVAHLMCQTALFYRFPMGDTSRFFVRKRRDTGDKEA